MECERKERPERPERGELAPRIPEKRHGFFGAADVAERAAELEQAPSAEFSGEAGCERLLVQRNCLIFSSGAVVFAASSVQRSCVDSVRRGHMPNITWSHHPAIPRGLSV